MQKQLATSEMINRLVPSIFLIICLVGLPQLSETIYSPALPAITEGLKTTSHLVQWSLSIYFIGFAVGVAFWGKLSDHVGRRPAMLMGLVCYIIFSLFCGSSNNITILLLARFFQAFGISVGSVITQSIMRDCFTGVERNKIFSLASMAIALAPAFGPLLGGYLTEYFSWRANFIFLTSLGALLLIYAAANLPETYKYIAKPINHIPLSINTIFFNIIKDKHIIASSILVGAFNGILFSYYSIAPFIFIDIYQMKPQNFGMLGIFMATGVCLGSLLSHRLNHLIDTFKLIKLACAINLITMLIFLLLVASGAINIVNREISIVLIMLSMLMFYICFGVAIPNVLSKALVKYQNNIGAASSIFGLIYYIWVALFVFGIGIFLPNSLYVMPTYFLALSILMMIATFWLRAYKD